MAQETLFFSIRTKDENTVEKILNKSMNVEFDGLNVLQDSLKIGQIVFIVLGGDKPKWDTGLAGVGVLSKEPYDVGYSGKNFKVQVDIKILLDTPIKREELLPYRDAYGTIGIGPITKWEPNQALSQVQEKNAMALFRAMIELSPSVSDELETLIGKEMMASVKGATVKMIEVPVVYGQDKSEAIKKYMQPENKNVSGSPKASNILLYGVPGCGKSYEIKTNYCNDDSHMERAVFHPDYTYSDFVGQILPKVSSDGKVTYEFAPGPFTRILEKSVNSDEAYYLVVEEINRGNAPAIFGDIFQLLDRDDSGESEYGISNEAIAEYVYKDKGRKVKIPGNLYILATMNTSDQNVFTLDTAFKRRWSMKRIENNIDGCDFADQDVCGSGISWGSFVKTVNKLIIEVNAENLSNEDNRLGAYFVKLNELKNPDLFGEKVLMYLWNDAFKYDHERVFKPEYRTLDELIDGFKVNGLDVFVNEVKFSDDITESSSNSVVKDIEVEKYLEGKKDHLVAYYNHLRKLVKEKVPNSHESSTGSLQYAAWRADDIKKSSFADLQIQSDRMLIFTEIPQKQDYVELGEIIPKDGHHNHYFKIIYSDEKANEIVDIIIESYEQLKEGE